jgi:hypothetical protein
MIFIILKRIFKRYGHFKTRLDEYNSAQYRLDNYVRRVELIYPQCVKWRNKKFIPTIFVKKSNDRKP